MKSYVAKIILVVIFLVAFGFLGIVIAQENDFPSDVVQEDGESTFADENALESVESSIESSGNYLSRAEFYLGQKKYDEALKWLNEGLQINPNDSKLYLL